ncbi:hypothetical protein ACFX1T_021603 [Malus domestica]
MSSSSRIGDDGVLPLYRQGGSLSHIEEVGQLCSRYRLFDHSSKGDHDWPKETFEISGEWESDFSHKLCVPTVFISGK